MPFRKRIPSFLAFSLLLLFPFSACVMGQLVNIASDDSRLKTAKTVAIFIEIGQTRPSPYPPDLARAKKQVLQKIEKWKRLAVVADPKQADLVLVITEFNEGGGAVASASGSEYSKTAVVREMSCLADKVTVYAGGKKPDAGDTPLWSKSEFCGWSWPLNRALDSFWKSAK